MALPLLLFVGLAGLSLARLAEIRRTRRTQGNIQADPTRSWIIAMLVLSGGLVLLTLLIEQAFSYQTLLGVVSALQPVWDAVGIVLYWIILGISFVLYWSIHPLVQLVRAIFGGESQNQNTTTPTSPNQPKLPANGNAGGIPAEWLTAGRWVLIALGILVALVIVLRAFRAFAAWRQTDEGGEERESLGATRLLSMQLHALLTNLANRFQRKLTAREPGTDAGQCVRVLYRRVLRQAAAQGLGRRLPETPQEFAWRLEAALGRPQATGAGPPGSADGSMPDEPPPRSAFSDPDLDTLTTAYEQTRYGNREPSLPEVTMLHERVERLLCRLEQRVGR